MPSARTAQGDSTRDAASPGRTRRRGEGAPRGARLPSTPWLGLGRSAERATAPRRSSQHGRRSAPAGAAHGRPRHEPQTGCLLRTATGCFTRQPRVPVHHWRRSRCACHGRVLQAAGPGVSQRSGLPRADNRQVNNTTNPLRSSRVDCSTPSQSFATIAQSSMLRTTNSQK